MIKSFRQKISIMLIASMLACSCPVNAFADEIIQENPDSGIATISETASISELDEYDASSESDADYAAAFKPAFEMSSGPIDGVVITVSAEEGVLPEGAKLAVKKINPDAEEMSDIDAAIDNYNTVEEKEDYSTKDNSFIFDIKIINAEGNVIQPDGTVQVKFELAEIRNDIVETQVYHLKNIKEADEAELNRLAEAARAVETDDDDDFEFPDGELINDLSSKTRYQSETMPDETEDEEASVIKETSFIAEELEVLNCEMDESGKSVELVTATDSFSLFKFVLLGANDIAEARIEGKTEYCTLADAVDAFVASDEEIILLHDVVLSETLVIDKNVVLNLNGHSITGRGGFSLITINAGKKLTVRGDSGIVSLNSTNQYAFNNEGYLTLTGGVSVGASLGSCFGGTGQLHIDTLGSIGGSEYNGETTVESGQFGSSASFNTAATITGGTFNGTTTFSGQTNISGNSVFSGTVTFNDTNVNNTTVITGGSFTETVTISNKGTVDIEYGEFTDSTKSLVISDGKVLFKEGFISIGEITGGEVEVSGGTFEKQFTARGGLATISQGDFKSVNTFFVSEENVMVYVTGGEFSATAIDISNPRTVSITGGSFDIDVSLYIDNNRYMCERKSDGRWYVSLKTNYCARIGNVYYATLSEALARVQEGETIVLLKNYVNVGSIPASPSVSFSIDMNNCVVPSGCDLTLYSKTVTVMNGTVRANIRATESGKIVLKSGYFGGSISADGNGSIEAQGGYFTNDPSAFVPESGYTCDELTTPLDISGAFYYYVVSRTSEHVAKIGNKTYRTLETALSAAQSGDEIELIQDITVQDTIVINKAVSLVLGNHDIESTAASTAVSIESSNVVITSTGGELKCYSTTTGKYVGIDVLKDCSLQTLNLNVEFSSTAKYSTLDAIRNNGTLTFENGHITAPIPDGSYVYMIYSQLGTTQLTGSTVTATTNGNGKFIKATGVTANASGNIILTNTQVLISNSHKDSGTVYGIELMGTGNFTMESGSRLDVNCPEAEGIKEVFGVFKPTVGGTITFDRSKVLVNAPKIDGVRGISLWNDPVTLSNLSGIECHGNKNAIAYYSGGDQSSNITDSSLVVISDSNASACISSSIAYVYTSGGYYFVDKASAGSTTQPRYFISNVRARGGYYNMQPEDSFMDEGYTVQHLQNPDHIDYDKRTYYYGIKMTKVAKIMGRPGGTVYYETLESAINAVSDTETITIMQPIELENTVQVVNTNNTFSIDLAGFDIYGNIPGRDTVPASVLWISSGDVTLKGNGKVYNTNATVSETSAVRVTGGSLTIENGEYSVTGASGGNPSSVIYVGGDNTNVAAAYIKNGKFTAKGTNGYTVFVGTKGTASISETGNDNGTEDPETGSGKNCGFFRTEKAAGPVFATEDDGKIIISAGYLSHRISNGNGITIAPGKTCLDNHDTATKEKYPYYIDDDPEDNVAIIVETGAKFEVLSKAFDNATSGQTVKLLQNISSKDQFVADGTETIKLKEEKSLILNLDGFSINIGTSDYLFSVYNKTQLTLNGDGAIINPENSAGEGGAFDVYNNGKVCVKNATITANVCFNTGRYMFDINLPGYVEIEDGKFKGKLVIVENSMSSIIVSGGIYDREVVAPVTFTQYHECVANTDIEPTDVYPWKVAEYFEAEIVGERTYHLLSEAYAELTAGQTIRVLRDVNSPSKEYRFSSLQQGSTLDLNGHSVICEAFTSVGGQVKDSSEGSGRILPNGQSITINENNNKMPIYYEGDEVVTPGYRFFTYEYGKKADPLIKDVSGTDKLTYRYKLLFFDPEGNRNYSSNAYYMLKMGGGPAAGYNLKSHVVWKDTTDYYFTYSDVDLLQKYGDMVYGAQTASVPTIYLYFLTDFTKSFKAQTTMIMDGTKLKYSRSADGGTYEQIK